MKTENTLAWSDHRLREITEAGRYVASILDDPYLGLIEETHQRTFTRDVVNLRDWLAPVEEWSRNEKARPRDLSPAILSALFSLRNLLLSLVLPTDPAGIGMGLSILIGNSEPVRREFRNAVVKLSNLADGDVLPPTDGLPGNLNDAEGNILEALGDVPIRGEPLAKKAGYPYNAHFKSTLSNLKKRGLIDNQGAGYFRKR